MAPPTQIRISREWLQLLEALPGGGRVLVVGPSDSGKTTLCQWLVGKLRERAPTAWVDADVGQSQVGPPACVGWRMAGAERESFYFVGDVTPATVPLAAAAATARAVHDAEAQGAGVAVIDTTGYLEGEGALALKSAKLELLAPLDLLAVGDSPPVRRLLAAWHRDQRLRVHRVPTAEGLRRKTPAERCEWRQRLFAASFAGCDLRRVGLRGLALSGLPTARELADRGLQWSDLSGLLVGFHDARRRGIVVGLLHSLDLRGGEMVVRTRPEAESAVGVSFGRIRLRPDGASLGPCP